MIRNALGANVKRDFVLVKVTADDGTVGYGEAHHGQNPTAMAEIIQGGIGTLVTGSDPFDTEGIWERVRHQQVQTHGLGAGSLIALSGIDIALWDLKGKLLGQPVYRLLGGTAQAPSRLRGRPHPRLPATGLARRGGRAPSSTAGTPRSSSGSGTPRGATRSGSPGCGATSGTGSTSRWTPRPATPRRTSSRSIAYCEDHGVYWLEEPFPPDAVGRLPGPRGADPRPPRGGREPLRPAGGAGAPRSARDRRRAGRLHQGGRDLGGQEDLRHGRRVAHQVRSPHEPLDVERGRERPPPLRPRQRPHLRGGRSPRQSLPDRPRPQPPRGPRRAHRAATTHPASGSTSTRRCSPTTPQCPDPATFPAAERTRPLRGRPRGEDARGGWPDRTTRRLRHEARHVHASDPRLSPWVPHPSQRGHGRHPLRRRGRIRRGVARGALRPPLRAHPVAAHADGRPHPGDRAHQALHRRHLPPVPAPRDRRRAGRPVRPHVEGALHVRHRPGGDPARLRDVQAPRRGPDGDDRGVDRHDPRHLVFRPTLRIPREGTGTSRSGTRSCRTSGSARWASPTRTRIPRSCCPQ